MMSHHSRDATASARRGSVGTGMHAVGHGRFYIPQNLRVRVAGAEIVNSKLIGVHLYKQADRQTDALALPRSNHLLSVPFVRYGTPSLQLAHWPRDYRRLDVHRAAHSGRLGIDERAPLLLTVCQMLHEGEAKIQTMPSKRSTAPYHSLVVSVQPLARDR